MGNNTRKSSMVLVNTQISKKEYGEFIKIRTRLYDLKKIPEETDYAALKYILLGALNGFKIGLDQIKQEERAPPEIPTPPV